jgi:uncharacterized protein YceK
MEKWMIWLLIMLVSFVGSCGNILWKIASNHIGQVSWKELLNVQWNLKTLFTPLVFTALFLMFVGRFASMVPTGYMGITQLVTSITILTLTFTALLDTLLLQTKYPLNVWIGVVIGILAVYFIGSDLKV